MVIADWEAYVPLLSKPEVGKGISSECRVPFARYTKSCQHMETSGECWSHSHPASRPLAPNASCSRKVRLRKLVSSPSPIDLQTLFNRKRVFANVQILWTLKYLFVGQAQLGILQTLQILPLFYQKCRILDQLEHCMLEQTVFRSTLFGRYRRITYCQKEIWKIYFPWIAN